MPEPKDLSPKELAAHMHDLSIDLWNAFWADHGEDPCFPERESIEMIQQILTKLAWTTEIPL